MWFRSFAASILIACAAPASGADRLAPGQEGDLTVPDCRFPCKVYVPSDHRPGFKHPLIFFLHGAGGSPTTNPFKEITDGKGYLVVGLSYGGQDDGAAQGASTGAIPAMIAFIAKVRDLVDRTYGVDQKRVFLTGLSMGGWGVNFYGFNEEVKGKNLYRGYCIIAAGGQRGDYPGKDFTVAKGLPLLLVNGERDQNLAEANDSKPILEKAGIDVKQVVLRGEGHVPTMNTLKPPVREWLREIEKKDARVKPVAGVKWEMATLEGSPAKESGQDRSAAVQAFIGKQEFVKSAVEDRPVLVYLFSRAAGQAGTKEAARSEAVEQTVFSFPEAAGTPAASRFFACFKVDLTGRKGDPLLGEKSAPLVLLFKKDGSPGGIFQASQIKDAALLKAMQSLLSPEEGGKVDALVEKWKPSLQDLKKVEKKIKAQNLTLSRLKAASGAANAKAAQKVEGDLSNLEKERERLQKAVTAES
jgi:predicted esterase